MEIGFQKVTGYDTMYTLSRGNFEVTLIPNGQSYIPYLWSDKLLICVEKKNMTRLGIPCIQISDMEKLQEFLSAVPNIINAFSLNQQWIWQNDNGNA